MELNRRLPFTNVSDVVQEGLSAEELELLERAEEPLPLYQLAYIYFFGIGKEKNLVSAYQYTKRAAIKGLKEAQFELACFYSNGIGTERNEKNAFEWYQKAARSGNAEAQYEVALRFRSACGTFKDNGKAFKWTMRAANSGHPRAEFLYACNLFSEGNVEKAIDFFSRSGTKGNIEAQYVLGTIYCGAKKSSFVKIDYAKAVHWFQKASFGGHKQARLHLCKTILDGKYTQFCGDGGEYDALTAVSMLKDMADSEPEAAYHLGMFYKEDDPDSAFLWLQQASQRGYPAGIYEFGNCFANKVGTKEDKELAIHYWELSAHKGYWKAQWRIVRHHIDENNQEKARIWLDKAAAQGTNCAKDILQQLSENDLELLEIDRQMRRAPSAGSVFGSRRERLSTQSDSVLVRASSPSRSASQGANFVEKKSKRPTFHREEQPSQLEKKNTSNPQSPQKNRNKQSNQQEAEYAPPSFILDALGRGIGAILGAGVGVVLGIRASELANTREDLCVGIGVGSGLYLGSSVGSYAASGSFGKSLIFASLACLGSYTLARLLPRPLLLK